MARYAILTNDLQYDLINKNEERRKQVERFAPSMIRFLKKMREMNIPIVHLQLIYDEDDNHAELHNGVLPVLRGTKGAMIAQDYLDDRDIIVEKNKDSGFFETKLDERLKVLGVDTIVITGMQTQICVQTTAADAYFRGYHVIVPSDGVVSTRDSDKQRALDWLASYCAVVSDLDSIERKIVDGTQFQFNVVPIP